MEEKTNAPRLRMVGVVILFVAIVVTIAGFIIGGENAAFFYLASSFFSVVATGVLLFSNKRASKGLPLVAVALAIGALCGLLIQWDVQGI